MKTTNIILIQKNESKIILCIELFGSNVDNVFIDFFYKFKKSDIKLFLNGLYIFISSINIYLSLSLFSSLIVSLLSPLLSPSQNVYLCFLNIDNYYLEAIN